MNTCREKAWRGVKEIGDGLGRKEFVKKLKTAK